MSNTGRGRATSRGLGKGMIVAAWLLLLVMLTWFFNGLLDRQQNPNQHLATATPGGIAEVRLERNRYGHYVATGAINGQPVRFLLDTGATDVSIPVSIADRLGLERGQAVYYHTANGTVTAWRTTADVVQLGPLQLGPVRASINPNDNTDAVLLGMSFLKQLDFSQQGNTLTLRYPNQGPANQWNSSSN